MARPQRIFLPGHPQHVAVRGHNQGPVFQDDDDRRGYLAHLRTVTREYRVALHAYVLLDDRIHLLLTPSTPEGISRMMQALGRRYVADFNRRHGRTGTLWEGRFASHLVDAEAVLDCQGFIETAPERMTGQATRSDQYAWSSAPHHLGVRTDALITDHAAVWALGNTPFEREAAYRERLAQGVTALQQRAIEQALRQGLLYGSVQARQRLERELHRPLAPRPRGRPRKGAPTGNDSGTN